MAIKKSVSDNDKKIVIAISGRFDFALHQDFRESYIEQSQAGYQFVLDLSKTEYMDSSALGMILLLKDHVDAFKSTMLILRPNEAVNKILEIANFHRLITIEK